MSTTARAIVDEVLGRAMTREIWTGNYEKALPVSVQYFDLSAVLPAVFYMFRFGHRRGKGEFLKTFGGAGATMKQQKQEATIERIAIKLASADPFDGFEGETEQAILGDLLLAFCLENVKRALGRNEQVQRVFPAHYMASWVDIPQPVVHLRYVPEMIVAMLADQKGYYVEQNQDGDRTWFAVGRGFEDNVLLRAFHQGVVRRDEIGELGNRASDRFEENTPVGLDQLLMIRLAQQLGAAPDKLRGKAEGGDRIPNQWPIAEQAGRYFSEDIRRFVRAYAGVIPRHAFVELLESCMAVGLTTIVISVIDLLFEWADTGEVRKKSDQKPVHFFVDCSNGVDRGLRALAEQSLDDFMRRIEHFPVILMALRLLDHGARYDRKLKSLDLHNHTRPSAAEWLNLLGDLLHERREEAKPVIYDLDRKAEELADKLEEDYGEAAEILRNDRAQPSPVWRLAEALTALQGRKNTQAHLIQLIDSVMLVTRPNGLAMKRKVTRTVASGGGKKTREVRSMVFTDSTLDYLVHRHVLKGGKGSGWKPLAFQDFIKILRDRYGLCVDTAPAEMTISNDLLQANSGVLERRLRDLGLLAGVNDAESMKHLRPRFEMAKEDEPEME